MRLGGYATMTQKNVSTVLIEDKLKLDPAKYEVFFDDGEFEDAREQYHGLGNGQSIIFEFRTGIRDLETGDESTMVKVKYTFVKDLSLNELFGE